MMLYPKLELQVSCVLVFPLLSYKIYITLDVVIVYQQIMELVFYHPTIVSLYISELHDFIVPCRGTIRALFTNYHNISKSRNSTSLTRFRACKHSG